jgi:hypothetical protein
MASDFHFSLLENGLDFLISSLEHLTDASAYPKTPLETLRQAPNQKRHLKYALLHLCSSIELIFKERLRQEHWSLVFKDIAKANRNAYDSGDFQSVTFQEAQDRLVSICEIEFTQKQLTDLRNLRDRRNKIEHFSAVDSLPAVQSGVSKMVSFLVDFVERAFDHESLDEEEALIGTVRSMLGNCNSVVEHRWKEIQSEVDEQYSSIECPTCQQKALSADGGTVKCLFCKYVADSVTAAEEYVSNILGLHSRYAEQKDGGEWPITACPSCGSSTFVTQVPDVGDSYGAYCFTCGQEYQAGELEQCYDCGRLYNPGEEKGHHICRDCFQDRVNKDD